MQRGRPVHDRTFGHHRLVETASGLVADAAHGLNDWVEALPVPVRPVLAEAGDRGQYDSGVDLAHLLVAETHLLHGTGPEVLQHHVGDFQKPEEQLFAFRVAGIEGDALLAPVVGRKLDAHLPDERAGVTQVAGLAPLQFDDLGAHIPKDHATPGSGLPASQFQDSYAIQHSGGLGRGHVFFLRLRFSRDCESIARFFGGKGRRPRGK